MSVASCVRCGALEARIAALEAENARLKDTLLATKSPSDAKDSAAPIEDLHVANEYSPLSRSEMERYSRQMLVPDFRVSRQLRLRGSKVLVIGAGGLGCPVAMYLGAMGVGTIRLVDNDRVERSNLHRQIGHDESARGQLKVLSLARRVHSMNPDIAIETHAVRFTITNAVELVQGCDAVVDASDNPTTRYLINRVCATLKRPLISGSALGLEGQVTVFTYGPDSPCYQCMYPTAPAQPQSCEENGVLGIVPGIIGCIQALETVKVLTDMGKSPTTTQLLVDAFDSQFRRVKVPASRRDSCPGCGPTSSYSGLDFMASCFHPSSADINLGPQHRISIDKFAQLRREKRVAYTLIDTRPTHQFEMVAYPEAINIPFEQLRRERLKGRLIDLVWKRLGRRPSDAQLLVICRRGVDSELVTSWLVDGGLMNVCNVEGGYTAFAASEDTSFPMY